MKALEKKVDDAKRLDEILSILSRQGFGWVVERLNLKHRLPFSHRLKKTPKPAPERLRETFEELGPTFIKFGQILAERPDLVPQKYIDELEKLQDTVPEFDPETSRRIIRNEVGPIEENFSSFEDEPMAAASIAQVHRATLETGEEVIVKVRRPDIKEEVERDLDIMIKLAERAEKHSQELRDLQIHSAVKEFASWTRDELDLTQEMKNAQIFQKNMSDQENVKIPEVYPDYTTEKVLVMERVSGVKCTEREKLRELDIDREELAETVIDSTLRQIVGDGFFHADPHPSNFMVDGQNLIYIDFGMMGKLTREQRKEIGILLLRAASEDVEGVLDSLRSIGHVKEDAELDKLKEDIQEKMLIIRNSSLEENSLSAEIFDLIVKATRKGIVMPTSFVLMGKALVTMEGVGLTVYPEFEIKTKYKKTVREVLYQEYGGQESLDKFAADALEHSDLITNLPSRIDEMTRQNETKVEVVNEGRDSFTTVIGAALLISSGILMAQVMPEDYLVVVAVVELAIAGMIIARY
jgi:ubiquinone biosynthesis protein